MTRRPLLFTCFPSFEVMSIIARICSKTKRQNDLLPLPAVTLVQGQGHGHVEISGGAEGGVGVPGHDVFVLEQPVQKLQFPVVPRL